MIAFTATSEMLGGPEGGPDARPKSGPTGMFATQGEKHNLFLGYALGSSISYVTPDIISRLRRNCDDNKEVVVAVWNVLSFMPLRD